MKVIKPGVRPEDKSYRWTCDNCEAVIESTKAEGTYVFDQRDGDAIVFECPECKKKNWLAASLYKR